VTAAHAGQLYQSRCGGSESSRARRYPIVQGFINQSIGSVKDTLAKGQRVSFEEGASRRTGKLEAKNVTVIEASVERVRRYG
jgi:hypothetical protein